MSSVAGNMRLTTRRSLVSEACCTSMSVAFRIRTSAGQELSFASRASFEDFVRSGDLSPDDLVYDGETGSWSPSRTHPIVLEIEYEAEAEAAGEAGDGADAATGDADGGGADEEAGGDARGADDGESVASGEDGGPTDAGEEDAPPADLGLSLAPARESAPPKSEEESYVDGGVPEIERPVSLPTAELDAETEEMDLDLTPVADVSPEEASQAFVEKMEAERAASFDFGAGATASGSVRMENRGSMGEMITPRSETTTRKEDPPPRRRESAPEAVPRRPAPAPARGRRGVGLVVVGVVVAAGSWFGYTQLQPEETVAPPANQPVAPIAVPPAPAVDDTPAIPSAEVDVRARARERFLTASQLLIRDLPSVPTEWATAEYFVRPTEYPGIVPVWESYLVAIRNMRAQDRERYTRAYNGALDDARITGDARSDRLQGALAGFDSVAVRREAHYDRVEALASAAIQSHGVLVEAEGLLLTDATAEGGPGGLGAGVSARDADTQLLFDQVIEVLSARLSASGLGPRTGENVREWIWDGFLRAVTTGG